MVNLCGDRPLAEAIVDKRLADDVLARDVYNRLEAIRVRTRREGKRRSAAQNGGQTRSSEPKRTVGALK